MFKGREIATGQPVVAHLMVAGRTPENEALLAQVAKLAPPFASHVRDVGEHEGTPYVVTDVLPGGIGLREYVRTAVAATPRVPVPPPPPPRRRRRHRRQRGPTPQRSRVSAYGACRPTSPNRNPRPKRRNPLLTISTACSTRLRRRRPRRQRSRRRRSQPPLPRRRPANSLACSRPSRPQPPRPRRRLLRRPPRSQRCNPPPTISTACSGVLPQRRRPRRRRSKRR